MNKRFYTPMLVLGLVGLSIFGADQVRAQGGFGSYQTLVQRIAQKFNLKEADVQTVFDEVQKDRQTMMKTKFEDRLSEEVKNGNLTEKQKGLIVAKHEELQKIRTGNKADLEKWAKDNGIDPKYVFGGMGKFKNRAWAEK